jgi:acetyl esterase/lipase
MNDKPQVTVREGVVFGRGGGSELLCDVFTPPARSAPAPGLLLVHGGGWRAGDRTQMRAYGIQLALRGFVCVSSSYRLVPQARWPAPIEDVNAAIRYLRGNAAELGVDREKIAAVGASAGAHLVLLAAGTPDVAEFQGVGGTPGIDTRLQAVVGIFAPTVIAARGQTPSGSVPGRVLLDDTDDEATARKASPIAHVTASFPPTLLLHGTADKVVPPSASMRMYEALAGAGVPVDLHMVAEQPHGYVVQRDYHRLSCDQINVFLRRYLGLQPKVRMPEYAMGQQRFGL